nr:hypothetical protein [Kibdelosporangium sp. MJ126-NF4]CEL16459.1 hypothetical protein [Kibdelosporangium sp. MJ126-NF4]CTQ90411.1 hypothetical protein [Kibdelosporangium sp. MJ126-NF4]
MTETHTETTDTAAAGFDMPPLRRLRYFHGQMLSARDFQREQEYFREKLKLRMRCLLGYGVVCGLKVKPVHHHDEAEAETPTDTDTDAGTDAERRRRKAKIRITSGLGVDCDGNEVVVRDGCVIDLYSALPEDERDKTTVWVGVEYCERAVEPTRAVYNDGCADDSDCEFGFTEESYAIRVTGCEPPRDERCDTCCSRCEHKVLWLARIDDVDFHQPLRSDQIHMNIRRPFGRYVPTVITGVNWIHGHTYSVDEAKALLGTQNEDGGLVVRFSGDIRVDSLQPGVVEIQVIEGGAGRNASTWYMGGKFEEPGETDHEFTQDFRYRQTTREVLQDGDRVLVTIRAAFILDRCCRPVDGTNVGGKVPYLEPVTDESAQQEQEQHRRGCELPPSGIGPWTSGTGAGGDVFESWFFVKER